MLVALVVVGCSAQSPQPTAVHSTASPSVVATTPGGPSPTSSAAASDVGLSCRIPVMLSGYQGDTPGGWITFPGGSFHEDPSSKIPRQTNNELISFDRAFNRWVPATWDHISPDGRRYAVAIGSGVDLVDVATGQHRAMAMPQVNGSWSVINFNAKGVYLTLLGGEGPAEPGLWLLDPDSAAVRKLDGTQLWSQVDSRAAWTVVPITGGWELRRLDLQAGIVSTELTIPYRVAVPGADQPLELISLDAQGRPLVLERDWPEPHPWRIGLLTATEHLQPVQFPDEWTVGSTPAMNGKGRIKGHLLSGGIWFTGEFSFAGLAFLPTATTVIRPVATGPGNIVAIAGGCH